MAFIDANRADFGVEPICTVLRSAGVQVAPSTYYAAKNRQPSAREQRDTAMIPNLVKIWEANYRVYGARKLWKAARRAGHDIGRDQTARLLGIAGIEVLTVSLDGDQWVVVRRRGCRRGFVRSGVRRHHHRAEYRSALGRGSDRRAGRLAG